MKYDSRILKIHLKLANASNYFKLMEAQLQDAHNLEAFQLAEKYDITDEEQEKEHSAMKDYLDDDFNEDLRPLFRHSFLISLHSLAETSLHAICDEITKERDFDIKAKEFRGGPIGQASIFLTKIAKVPFQDLKGRQDMKDLQLVRNCLVHADGTISKIQKLEDQERIWILLEQPAGLRLDKHHDAISKFTDNKHPAEARIIAESLYLQRSLESAKAFFDDLFFKLGWK